MRSAAKIVSYVFHPLLLVTYLVLVLASFMPHFLLIPASSIRTFAGFVFVMTFILPAGNILMFKAFGTLPSLHMETRQDRIIPFVLITIIYAVITGMFFYKVSANVNFNKVMLIVASLVFVSTLATFFDKISVHSLSICGLVGILVPLNKAVDDGSLLFPTLVILVLAGVVMSSRLYLNAHTPRQVLYGAVLGFSVSFFGMIYLF